VASVECASDCESEVCYMQVIIEPYDIRQFLNYEERRGVSSVLWGNLRERDHLGDTNIFARLILRWIFRKWEAGLWTG